MIRFNSFNVLSDLSSYIEEQWGGVRCGTSLFLSRTHRTLVIGMYTSLPAGASPSTWRVGFGGLCAGGGVWEMSTPDLSGVGVVWIARSKSRVTSQSTSLNRSNPWGLWLQDDIVIVRHERLLRVVAQWYLRRDLALRRSTIS